MTLFGQTMNWSVLAVMWILMALAAVAGIVLGAAWRDLSLRRKWKKTEQDFEDQLRTQVSTRDAKILDLEREMSLSARREAELRGQVMSLQAKTAPVFAVVEMPDEEPQELVRHQVGESAEVI